MMVFPKHTTTRPRLKLQRTGTSANSYCDDGMQGLPDLKYDFPHDAIARYITGGRRIIPFWHHHGGRAGCHHAGGAGCHHG